MGRQSPGRPRKAPRRPSRPPAHAAHDERGPELHYRADITAGSLKLPESRVVADLLLRGANDAEMWNDAIRRDNVLQARSPRTARRLRLLLRGRLEAMGPDLWKLVRDGPGIVAMHACLAAAVKHSRLLGDFLDLVVREQYRVFSPALAKRHWQPFIVDCRSRDPDMPRWSESTIARLRSSVYQILAQAGYIENTRSLKLQSVHIAGEVLAYLHKHNEDYVIRCLQVGP